MRDHVTSAALNYIDVFEDCRSVAVMLLSTKKSAPAKRQTGAAAAAAVVAAAVVPATSAAVAGNSSMEGDALASTSSSSSSSSCSLSTASSYASLTEVNPGSHGNDDIGDDIAMVPEAAKVYVYTFIHIHMYTYVHMYMCIYVYDHMPIYPYASTLQVLADKAVEDLTSGKNHIRVAVRIRPLHDKESDIRSAESVKQLNSQLLLVCAIHV